MNATNTPADSIRTIAGKKEGVSPLWPTAIQACLENGTRLLEDAKYLAESHRFLTSRAIAILAQEEFAKAYLLRLVADGAIPDCDEIVRACRDHVCKHLVSVVMLHLYVPWESVEARVAEWSKPRPEPLLPRKIADAINILCHEKLLRWHDPHYDGLDDFDYDALAKRVWEGAIDRAKQDVLYVNVGRAGTIVGTPNCTVAEAEGDIATAVILKEVANGHDLFASEERLHIRDVLRIILEKLTVAR
jgi:AbiV family abortive infection protein